MFVYEGQMHALPLGFTLWTEADNDWMTPENLTL